MSSNGPLLAPHICTSPLQVVLQCLLNNMQLPLLVTPVAKEDLDNDEICVMLHQIKTLNALCGDLQLSVPCVSTSVQHELLKVLVSELSVGKK